MNVGISEFSFGYAFLHEQTVAHWPGLKAAPVLPSLHQEATKGWDAKLPTRGAAFYYQFKVSEYMKHPNSQLIRDGYFRSPYYRFHLHPRERFRQHRRLRLLSKSKSHVYYVTQEMTSLEDFNEAFLNTSVVANSRMIPLRACSAIREPGRHYIAFQSRSRNFYQCSDPVEGDGAVLGSNMLESYQSTRGEWQEVTVDFLEAELETLTSAARNVLRPDFDSMWAESAEEVAETELKFPFQARLRGIAEVREDARREAERLIGPRPYKERADRLMHAAEIASAFFGLSMMIVGSE